MKRLIYFSILLLAAIAIGCTKTDYLLFNGSSRVQLSDTTTINSTFFYRPTTVLKDTVYIQVSTIGNTTSKDRQVKLVQISEPGVLNPAVAGVHYIPVDDPSLKNLMVIKGNTVSAMIPVVLLRDASLKTASFRLSLQLAPNDEFLLGGQKSTTRTIVFSDRLERFYSWRIDQPSALAYYYFGKYSTRKHQFMYDCLKVPIDEDWFQAIKAIQAIDNYKNILKDALAAFNRDPVNIANGSAPMRETDLPSSAFVTFP